MLCGAKKNIHHSGAGRALQVARCTNFSEDKEAAAKHFNGFLFGDCNALYRVFLLVPPLKVLRMAKSL